MNRTDLDQRESKVLNFINARNKENSAMAQNDALFNSPEMKLRKLGSECGNGKSVCIDTLLGKLYKDALPFDDPKKNCSIDDARDEMHAFIAKRTDGKNSEYYVREAIRRNNSSLLKSILAESESVTKEFYKEKAKDIGNINIKDLNFRMNTDEEELTKITKKLEFDDIADIIHGNVQKAIKAEVEKAKKEEEYNKMIEDSLANDVSVQDDTSMESALSKFKVVAQPTVYQPSLFEAVMMGSTSIVHESTGENMFHEAVHEYTKLNIVKALKLESFTVDSVKKLANKYCS